LVSAAYTIYMQTSLENFDFFFKYFF